MNTWYVSGASSANPWLAADKGYIGILSGAGSYQYTYLPVLQWVAPASVTTLSWVVINVNNYKNMGAGDGVAVSLYVWAFRIIR
jgi:hypothetical protein